MGHLVGFTVTLGGLKVDGEGEDGLFRYSHQIGALLFGLLAAGVQLPAVFYQDHFLEGYEFFGAIAYDTIPVNNHRQTGIFKLVFANNL